MLSIKILLFLLLRNLSEATEDECSDDTPWMCHFEGTIPEIIDDIARDADVSEFIKTWPDYDSENYTIPESFDARKAWPQCEEIISRVKHQGRCGTCWAHCTTMVMTDRLCIVSNGSDFFDFSVQDLITCCETCTGREGKKKPWCRFGGYPLRPFVYVSERGLVSSRCKKYNVKLVDEALDKCVEDCDSLYEDYKHEQQRAGLYGIYKTPGTTIEQIQIEIMTNGPVCAFVKLMGHHFEKNYKQGVYISPSFDDYDVEVQGHLVRLLGWGTENGVDYWLGVNSWGTKWGDKGFFKIRRGTNEMSVETLLTAGMMHPLEKHPSYNCAKNVPKTHALLFFILLLFVTNVFL